MLGAKKCVVVNEPVVQSWPLNLVQFGDLIKVIETKQFLNWSDWTKTSHCSVEFRFHEKETFRHSFDAYHSRRIGNSSAFFHAFECISAISLSYTQQWTWFIMSVYRHIVKYVRDQYFARFKFNDASTKLIVLPFLRKNRIWIF